MVKFQKVNFRKKFKGISLKKAFSPKIEELIVKDLMRDKDTLNLKDTTKGTLDLSELKSIEDLVFPEKITGNLKLSKLKNTEGLILPKKIGGELHLPYLNEDLNPQDLEGIDVEDQSKKIR